MIAHKRQRQGKWHWLVVAWCAHASPGRNWKSRETSSLAL